MKKNDIDDVSDDKASILDFIARQPVVVATPISYEEIMETWDEVMERIAAGECFALYKDGKPLVYMIPYTKTSSGGGLAGNGG